MNIDILKNTWKLTALALETAQVKNKDKRKSDKRLLVGTFSEDKASYIHVDYVLTEPERGPIYIGTGNQGVIRNLWRNDPRHTKIALEQGIIRLFFESADADKLARELMGRLEKEGYDLIETPYTEKPVKKLNRTQRYAVKRQYARHLDCKVKDVNEDEALWWMKEFKPLKLEALWSKPGV
ncbi:hypothetical protein [Cupriavidus sp. amp6]|uniref:hypothetical protein n=1 Tax=Cupriavidus sp. amp6 TaxID=388051 RepID=UPI00041302DC|nr:hypothetical protein [Cupriavidus sp. amp6]